MDEPLYVSVNNVNNNDKTIINGMVLLSLIVLDNWTILPKSLCILININISLELFCEILQIVRQCEFGSSLTHNCHMIV